VGEQAPSRVGELVELDIGPVAHGGHCVARDEGQVVFVRHTLPGERVRARITEGRADSRFLRADAEEVLVASPHRVTPPCPYAGPGRCGGCDWQHASPAYSRELKAAVVSEQLRRLAGLELPVTVEPAPSPVDVDIGADAADRGLRWRTRVEFAVGEGGHAGLRRHRSHDVIPLDDCLIATDAVVGTGVLGRDWTGSRSVDVVAPSGGPDVVVVPVPSGEGSAPRVVEHVAVGEWSHEFVVGARGFWQVHAGAAATFVGHVLDELAPRPGDRAVDLYCGVGLFAAALAHAVGEDGAVLAIESDAGAVADAEDNLRALPQVEIRGGTVDRALRPLVRQGIRADLVVLDPPRSGAGRRVIRDVAALGARAIAYVACDPAALARDLAYAKDAGYRLDRLRAFDAFPMTHHVECIATLVREEPRERR
jgi:tRNA/tmRNA/rRNA uracil-C5-methylase (TrmA/RlmC/RlmD family)